MKRFIFFGMDFFFEIFKMQPMLSFLWTNFIIKSNLKKKKIYLFENLYRKHIRFRFVLKKKKITDGLRRLKYYILGISFVG